ncbi:hypothetical protein LINPERHAP2_LOCUS33676 [Linum perenne]
MDAGNKTHLISWEQICLPKEADGLGLRSARFLNRAFMTNLSFLFFQDLTPVWLRLLQGKYFKPTANGLAQRYRQSRSAVWKGLSVEWDVMLVGSRAVIRNG